MCEVCAAHPRFTLEDFPNFRSRASQHGCFYNSSEEHVRNSCLTGPEGGARAAAASPSAFLIEGGAVRIKRDFLLLFFHCLIWNS